MHYLDQLHSDSAEKINSSFYVYDEVQIDQNFDRFSKIGYANTEVYFASMANDNPHLLRMVCDRGMGIFVNSLKHLRLARDCGFSSEKIIFASTGLTKVMMRHLIDQKIRIHLDSVSQIQLYGSLSPHTEVGLRLNTSERSRNSPFTGDESRIGIQDHEIDAALEICSTYDLKVIGTHVYIGTDIVDVNEMMQGVERSLELSNLFPDLRYVDLGGGFPLDETTFDFSDYKERVSSLMEAYSRSRGRSIGVILEPGRAMFGNAGRFYAQITDIKRRPDRYIVCVDASASLIPRAMFYEDYNPVKVYRKGSALLPKFDLPVDICGNSTYSRDFLAKHQSLAIAQIGDWLEFGHAGSYCYSMITRFLGQTFPPEYLVDRSGDVRVIRVGDHGQELLQ